MAKLITKYKQEGHDQKFKDQWQFYLNLELISEAFNNIIKGEIQKAIEVFERLKEIPIQESDSAAKFYSKFEESKMKWILLDVLIAVGKCFYIDAMMINYQN